MYRSSVLHTARLKRIAQETGGGYNARYYRLFFFHLLLCLILKPPVARVRNAVHALSHDAAWRAFFVLPTKTSFGSHTLRDAVHALTHVATFDLGGIFFSYGYYYGGP